jgi:hypothetical protein
VSFPLPETRQINCAYIFGPDNNLKMITIKLTKVMTDGSWFDPEFTTRSNRAAFMRHLVEEISRPIMPRDEEFEYLPTQAVSEYLASCVEQRLDGAAIGPG